MALADILGALRKQAAEEIASIERARDTELAAINTRAQDACAKREGEAQHDRERRAHKIYERIISKARHQVAFIETKKQQEKIAAVFDAVVRTLTEMSTDAYKAYLTKHWNDQTPQEAARYVVAEERAQETIQFLTAQGVHESQITKKAGLLGGYQVILPHQEIDYSFTSLITRIQSEEVSRINQLLSE